MNEDPDPQTRTCWLAQQPEAGVLWQKAGVRQARVPRAGSKNPILFIRSQSLLYRKEAFDKTKSWAPDLNDPLQSDARPGPHDSIQDPEDNCEAHMTLLQLKQM